MAYNSKFGQNSSKMSIRSNGVNMRRRDIKERTMKHFAALDSDIASRYDNDDDDGLPINVRIKVVFLF
jgi:hypothetical protein